MFETFGAQDDFDQLNEEKQNYSKYTASYMQDSDKIDQESVNQKHSMRIFSQESNQRMMNKYVLQKSRQVHIGNRLISIRLEMQRLQKQLQANHELLKKNQEDAKKQAEILKNRPAKAKPEANADDEDKEETIEQPKQSELQLKKSEKDLTVATEQMDQFILLKQKLIKIYGLQGFKNMVKSNPNISQFLGVIQ